MEYVSAFIVGGLICVVGQILMDTTKLTPARILVIFVTVGAVLGAFGIYDKLVDIGGAGATIPLPSFGNSLAKAAIQAVQEDGLLGAFTGGIKGAAGGITAAIFFGTFPQKRAHCKHRENYNRHHAIPLQKCQKNYTCLLHSLPLPFFMLVDHFLEQLCFFFGNFLSSKKCCDKPWQ